MICDVLIFALSFCSCLTQTIIVPPTTTTTTTIFRYILERDCGGRVRLQGHCLRVRVASVDLVRRRADRLESAGKGLQKGN
jgi:hypothetical protein